MLLDPTKPSNKHFVYAVSASTIISTWMQNAHIPKLRFSRDRDVGITAYLTLVSFWFYKGIDPKILAPVFFADPAGAVIGKTMSNLSLNVPIYKSKTLFGSIAVFSFTYMTLSYDAGPREKALISLAATIGEALGGEWDNAVIAAVVMGGWCWI